MTTLGWYGLGIMGKSMATHLINKGYKLNVYNRTKSKADDLIALGATFKEPQQLAADSDVVLMCVGYPKDVERIVLDKNDGLINFMKKGSFLIDHTTSSPQLAENIFQQCKEKEIFAIDAPVSGGDIGAKNGQLSTMVGGDKEAVNKMMNILGAYSKTVSYMGSAGAGQKTKLCNQIVICSTMVGLCESLLFAQKSGLELQQMIDAIRGGAAGCKSIELYSSRMISKDYNPGFFVEHFIKDLNMALEAAKIYQLKLPGLELSKSLYQKLQDNGQDKLGTQALILALEEINKQ